MDRHAIADRAWARHGRVFEPRAMVWLLRKLGNILLKKKETVGGGSLFSAATKHGVTATREKRKTSTAERTAKPAPHRRYHVERGVQPHSDQASELGRDTMI